MNIHPKVTAATVGAAVVTVLVAVLAIFHVSLDAAVVGAIATIVAFIAGFATPSGTGTT